MTENLVALAYGSNLGDRTVNINRAVELLKQEGFDVIKVSEPMESQPVDCIAGSGIFLNGAIAGKWSGTSQELLALCQKIEKMLGRKEIREINSPRPIDLDILLFGREVIKEENLTVPHPRMNERDFVMLPLNEVAYDWVIPTSGCTVSEAARKFL